MFDLGWSELAVIALIALIVVGPKELPEVLRTVGLWVRKLRGMAREFQSSVDEMVREAELDDARKTVESARHLNIEKHIEDAVDPTGGVKDEVAEVEKSARRAARGEEDPGTKSGDGQDDPERPGASIVEQPHHPAPPHSIVPPKDDAVATEPDQVAGTTDTSKSKTQSA